MNRLKELVRDVQRSPKVDDLGQFINTLNHPRLQEHLLANSTIEAVRAGRGARRVKAQISSSSSTHSPGHRKNAVSHLGKVCWSLPLSFCFSRKKLSAAVEFL